MNLLSTIKQRYWGDCIRTIPDDTQKNLYLTFDDGPHPVATPTLLAALEAEKIKASFFVVAQRAQKHPSLLKEMQSLGFGIGNHSLDHRYSIFFQGKKKMIDWIQNSEKILEDILGQKTCGFRSPAGIQTPELHAALKDLRIDLIHWRWRFFDTALVWTKQRARAIMPKLTSGDIILLHDATCLKNKTFLNTLHWFIDLARQDGFEFKSLTPELVSRTNKKNYG